MIWERAVMYGEFNNVKIQGIYAAVPKTIEHNEMYGTVLGEKRVRKQSRLTGVISRRVSAREQFPSDLCYYSANELIGRLNWNREEISVLLFITQRPTFKVPSTAFFLHDKLGLGRECLCYDINLGCSGFNVGVQTAAALLQTSAERSKALVMIGDTTGLEKDRDKDSAPEEFVDEMLFGSVGTCVALEKVHGHRILFCNRSDGSGYRAIVGAPSEPSSMDGTAIFEFAINDVTESLSDFKKKYHIDETDIDYYIFHQANGMILDSMDDTCGILPCKELRSIETYGNTSGGSIPLSLCTNKDRFKNKGRIRILACGFGVGLSWGYIYTEIDTNTVFSVGETDFHFQDEISSPRIIPGARLLIIGTDCDIAKQGIHCYKVNGAILDLIEDGEDLETKDFGAYDAIVIYSSLPTERIIGLCKNVTHNKDGGAEISVIILRPYTASDYEEVIDTLRWDIKELSKKLNFRFNGVVYDKNTVDASLYGLGYLDWMTEYLKRGCSEIMIKASYIARVVSLLISDSGKYIDDSIINVR